MLRALAEAASIAFLSAAAIGCLSVAIAYPGLPMPVPRVPADEAISLAARTFRLAAAPADDRDTYFVRSVEYAARSVDGSGAADWAWYVTFIHPVHNDRTVVYRVGADGRAVPLGGME